MLVLDANTWNDVIAIAWVGPIGLILKLVNSYVEFIHNLCNTHFLPKKFKSSPKMARAVNKCDKRNIRTLLKHERFPLTLTNFICNVTRFYCKQVPNNDWWLVFSGTTIDQLSVLKFHTYSLIRRKTIGLRSAKYFVFGYCITFDKKQMFPDG